MQINGVIFNVDALDVIYELQSQLHANGIPLLNKIKDAGSNIMITCPYHKDGQERRPSAGIKKDDGTFHCLACGEIHSLQEVISYCFGKDGIVGAWGWTWLLKNFATSSIEERRAVTLDFERNYKHKNLDNSFITEDELDKYRYIHPYMYKRKLTDEIIELFDVGYDSETDCLTFPVRDILGNTLFIARRSVKSKFFNYPSEAEKPLYGLYELDTYGEDVKEVIVCESMIDALTCWTYGKYAVALNGLGTELQFNQLRNLHCRKLILATDNDSAGLKARKRIRQNVPNKLITEYILPKGKKDINELTKEEFENLEELF